MAGIHLEKTSGVASIVIDRPPLNVLNLALLRELRQALDAVDRDDGVELVEIRGAGERATAGTQGLPAWGNEPSRPAWT